MKKQINYFVIINLILFISISNLISNQKSDDIKSKIATIKEQYKSIKAEEKKYKITNITNDDEESEKSVQLFKSGTEIKKIIVAEAMGDCGESTEVYYHNNSAFFIFKVSECIAYDGDKEMVNKTEERYSIDNGKLIQLLIGKANIKTNDNEFKNAEEFVKELIQSLKIYK